MIRSESHPVGSPSAGDGRPPAVLVVDDDHTLRTVLASVLRRRGFVVWAAAGGAEAVAVYRHHGREIDVVLSDVNMPGMNGPDTLAALRGVAPGVSCCFMTADARPGTREALLALGGLAVLDKPFPSLADVCETLKGLVERFGRGRDRDAEQGELWTS